MSRVVTLIGETGRQERYTLSGDAVPDAKRNGPFIRHAIAAAHVTCDARADSDPSDPAAIDWESTMAFRLRLLDMGLDIAEAMDTAQRGMGLSHDDAMELIKRTLDAAGPERRNRIYAGIATDRLDPGAKTTLAEVERAYREQLATIQKSGGRAILMASPALSVTAQSSDDYISLYRSVLSDAEEPVILHWLGEMFDPRLDGYWGSSDFESASETVLNIIGDAQGRVQGIKLSLLDEAKEVSLRARLPEGVRLYTGDDFNYPGLIAGDAAHYSDALLGIFDPIAAVASSALDALSCGNRETYDELMAPTLPLAREIFRAPTRFYKTGVVFLAWLNGFQDHFAMLGGQQSMRSARHLCEVLRLADAAGVLSDADMAAHRMRCLMETYGVTT